MNSSSAAPAPQQSQSQASHHSTEGTSKALMIGALGVVFGDIGTSPLYTLNTLFMSEGSVSLSVPNIFGVLSLIFWALTLIISVKYVGFVMRADNKGEGGILALSTLLVAASRNWRLWSPVAALGVFGAAFFLGDGFITPPQSIMGAIEGVIVMSPRFAHVVVPGTVIALTVLFTVQRHGTGAVSKAFGPVMLLWFSCIALLGAISIIKTPGILLALSPYYAFHYLMNNGWPGFVSLSFVFLAITGGEALYADMGHFGRPPIRNAWFTIAMPALLINYFGQGALLLRNPGAINNPFYLLAPGWALPLLIMLAIAAAIIASQALISGVFSVARQAINLGYLPRLKVLHSSEDEIGQVYLPSMNWLLFAGTVMLTIKFGSAEALANAYGIAVSTNMVMVSIMLALLLPSMNWRYRRATSVLLVCTALIEVCFFVANMTKFFSGGWFPLVIAAGGYLLMSTWHEGRKNLNWLLTTQQVSTRDFLAQIEQEPPRRVAGTAVYLVSEASGVPRALTQNLRFNGVLHERNLLFTFSSAEVPSVPNEERVSVQTLAPGLFRVVARYGFMETPNIVGALRAAEEKGLEFKPEETMYVVGRENPVITGTRGMPAWRKRLFAIMGRNAQLAAVHFGVPAHRVVEIGSQVRL
ncbi:MAG TPA: KUP/HAK/KT family potassium transporter [Steroidobacteraceae bacterium]|nr:KUP/HAK/KT family potassium transporter [Steroidobacteraceae bacterium]